MDFSDKEQLAQLEQLAHERNWGLSLLVLGWWHLAAFSACYYLTIAHEYHDSTGYLAIWVTEFLGIAVIFRLCGGPRRDVAPTPLELLVRRVWISYFFLAFNLGTLNTLRGNRLFEFFPAIASLASFSLLMMTFLLSRRFFIAVVTMFLSGLVMAAHLAHAYLVFAVAWWLVLNGIGGTLMMKGRQTTQRDHRAATPAAMREPLQEAQ